MTIKLFKQELFNACHRDYVDQSVLETLLVLSLKKNYYHLEIILIQIVFLLFLLDTIMLWNIKYGTLQSLQILDKIPAVQPSLLQSVLPNGASCASSIPGFICVGFFHSVVVCQFTVDPCSLASALGQLDSTAK